MAMQLMHCQESHEKEKKLKIYKKKLLQNKFTIFCWRQTHHLYLKYFAKNHHQHFLPSRLCLA
jgi:hypothetical protein